MIIWRNHDRKIRHFQRPHAPPYLPTPQHITFAVHHGSNGSAKSLVHLEHFDLEEAPLWRESVATIGQWQRIPQAQRADWLSVRKAPPQRNFPSQFAILALFHFARSIAFYRKCLEDTEKPSGSFVLNYCLDADSWVWHVRWSRKSRKAMMKWVPTHPPWPPCLDPALTQFSLTYV